MTKQVFLFAAALMLVTSSAFAQRETKFRTEFEYGSLSDEPFVFEPLDLNGAEGQVGEWTGAEIPEGSGGDILPGAPLDAAGFKNNPYDGSRLLVLDRPGGDPDNDGVNYKGSIDAELTEPVLLLGAEVSFELGVRRTGGNNNKDFDIVGRGSDGAESFRLRVGTNNNGGERLGYVTNDGADVVFDLPTVVGEDAGTDMNNTGYNGGITGPFDDDTGGPGVGAEFAGIKLTLSGDGFVIDFAHNELNTTAEANAYTSDVLPYNGNAMDLALVEFGYSGSGSTGVNSGWFLDNVLITGFEEILQGDFNANGELDFEDYLILVDNLGTSGPDGDYDFNGAVDLADFAQLKTAFAAQGAAAASVPEPGSLGMAVVALLGFMARRRRR